MNSKKNGGPAFPTTYRINEVGNIVFESVPGMSLRDYFLSQQTAAWIIAFGMRYKEDGARDDDMIHYAVEYGKRTADAMLAARKEKK